MTDIVNEHLLRHREAQKHARPVPRLACRDGFTMSVQAASFNYCTPRADRAARYIAFEVGFPSAEEALLMPYAEEADHPTTTVYGWVPLGVILAVIEAHGGLED